MTRNEECRLLNNLDIYKQPSSAYACGESAVCALKCFRLQFAVKIENRLASSNNRCFLFFDHFLGTFVFACQCKSATKNRRLSKKFGNFFSFYASNCLIRSRNDYEPYEQAEKSHVACSLVYSQWRQSRSHSTARRNNNNNRRADRREKKRRRTAYQRSFLVSSLLRARINQASSSSRAPRQRVRAPCIAMRADQTHNARALVLQAARKKRTLSTTLVLYERRLFATAALRCASSLRRARRTLVVVIIFAV